MFYDFTKAPAYFTPERLKRDDWYIETDSFHCMPTVKRSRLIGFKMAAYVKAQKVDLANADLLMPVAVAALECIAPNENPYSIPLANYFMLEYLNADQEVTIDVGAAVLRLRVQLPPYSPPIIKSPSLPVASVTVLAQFDKMLNKAHPVVTGPYNTSIPASDFLKNHAPVEYATSFAKWSAVNGDDYE